MSMYFKNVHFKKAVTFSPSFNIKVLYKGLNYCYGNHHNHAHWFTYITKS